MHSTITVGFRLHERSEQHVAEIKVDPDRLGLLPLPEDRELEGAIDAKRIAAWQERQREVWVGHLSHELANYLALAIIEAIQAGDTTNGYIREETERMNEI